MSSRERILSAVRQALQDQPPAVDVPRNYQRHRSASTQEVIDLLLDRVTDYRAQAIVTSAEGLAEATAGCLAAVRNFVVPEGLAQQYPWLREDPRCRVDHSLLDNALSINELTTMDVVVTSCAVAVAESGTLILDAGPDQGRRAISLVPDHHICLVPAENIVPILPQALARIDGTQPLTMISGPSATSDIELERVEGVHGPRQLDVLIIQ